MTLIITPREQTFKEISEQMGKVNSTGKYRCYFKGKNNEVHVIIEEVAVTII